MGLSYAEFDAVFARFAASPTSVSVFRLEALQHYQVPSDDPFLAAFRTGAPRPERSVRTSPWLARIAASVAAGKRWERVHLVREPLTEYLRLELLAYVESQAAGEAIYLADSGAAHPAEGGPDFWLFEDSAGDYAILMHYDGDGAPLSFDLESDPQLLADLHSEKQAALSGSVSLNEYLARTPNARTTATVGKVAS